MSKVQSLFETLKENEAKDKEALSVSQKKYEAVAAGMEVNEEGKTQSLQEQLMVAKQEAAEANTQRKQASMELSFCQNSLKEKQKTLGTNATDYQKDKINLDKIMKESVSLEQNLGKINYSEENMQHWSSRRSDIRKEIHRIRERIDNFEAHRPYSSFKYRDPETNFNRNRVFGGVCRLIQVNDNTVCTALETAAGGRVRRQFGFSQKRLHTQILCMENVLRYP